MIVKLRGVMMESPAACSVAIVSFFLSWEGWERERFLGDAVSGAYLEGLNNSAHPPFPTISSLLLLSLSSPPHPHPPSPSPFPFFFALTAGMSWLFLDWFVPLYLLVSVLVLAGFGACLYFLEPGLQDAHKWSNKTVRHHPLVASVNCRDDDSNALIWSRGRGEAGGRLTIWTGVLPPGHPWDGSQHPNDRGRKMGEKGRERRGTLSVVW